MSMVSASVAALVKLGAQSMLLTNLKVAALGTLVILLMAVGFTRPSADQRPAQAPSVEKSLADVSTPRTDAAGDALPAHALTRLGTQRFRSDSRSERIVAVHGGKHVLGWGLTAVIMWDTATGREVRRFQVPRWRKKGGSGYSVRIQSMAVSPDGIILAAGTGDASRLDCPIFLFDLNSGRKLGELPGHPATEFGTANRALAFVAPKRLASAGADHTLRTWDLDTKREISRLEIPPGSFISDLMPSADGKQAFVAGAMDNASFWAVWDFAAGKLTHRERGLPGMFARLALSADGKMVGISTGTGDFDQPGGSNEVRIYSASDRKEIRRWRTHSGRFPQQNNLLAFSPDGRYLATAGADQTVRRWDLATGKEIGPPIGRRGFGCNISYLDSSTLITFGSGQAVELWDAVSGGAKPAFVGSAGHLEALAFSSDGRHVATGGGGGDATVRVWDAANGKQVAHLAAANMYDITAVQFSPDGKWLASADSTGTARLWDWAAGKEIRSFPDHKPWLRSIAFHPDGQQFATGDEAGLIRVWHVQGAKPVCTLAGHDGNVTCLTFSADGRTLFSGGWDHTIRKWSLPAGKETMVIKGVHIGVTVAGQPSPKPVGHTAEVTCLALSPDGRRLFSGSADHMICVWEVSSGRLCRILKSPNRLLLSSVRAIALSPDGKTLAAAINEDGSETRVHVWDVLTGAKLAALAGHRGQVTKVAFSPDGKRLVSCSTDTTALVWDVAGLLPHRAKVEAKVLAGAWERLADPDPENGYTEVCRLVTAGDAAVSLLRGKLKRSVAADAAKVTDLIKDIDSPVFSKREQATRSLKALGLVIEPLVRKVISTSSLETRRRLATILAEFAARMLQHERAIEVLEMIGTPNARALLQDMAKGDPNARLTRDARDAVRRVNERR